MLASLLKNFRLVLGRSLRETGQALDRVGCKFSRDVGYLERLSRHRTLLPLDEIWPSHGASFISPSASLVGDVQVGNDCIVWYGAMLKGDLFAIRLGDSVVVGENTTIRNYHNMPNGLPHSTTIADNVVIGANSVLASCTIDSYCRVGAGSVICQGARLERGCVVLPGSVVSPGAVVPAYTVYGGNPAHFVRDAGEEDLTEFARLLGEERSAGETQASLLKALGH